MTRQLFLRWIFPSLFGALLGGLSVYFYLDVNGQVWSKSSINGGGNDAADVARRPAASINGQTAMSAVSSNDAGREKTLDMFKNQRPGNSAQPNALSDNQRESHVVSDRPEGRNPPDVLTDQENRAIDALKTQAYNPATTLAEIMSSPDATSLSPVAREKLLSELVMMLNRGEVNPKSLLPGYTQAP